MSRNSNIGQCTFFSIDFIFHGLVTNTSRKGMALSSSGSSVNCILPVRSMLFKWAVKWSLGASLMISKESSTYLFLLQSAELPVGGCHKH